MPQKEMSRTEGEKVSHLITFFVHSLEKSVAALLTE